MSAGQESGSPIRENRTLLPAPLPPDEARGTLAAAAGVSTVGLRPPFDTPQRHSHPVCRAILTLIVALDLELPSRFRRFEIEQCKQLPSRADNKENDSTLFLPMRLFTQAGPIGEES